MAEKEHYHTSDFAFHLPPEQIAQHPSERRDQSRLLVVDRGNDELSHRHFPDVVELIRPGDALVVNETRVFPARLTGRRQGGGAAEIFLLHPAAQGPAHWTALVRPGAKLRAGKRVEIAPELAVEILEVLPGGERLVRLDTALDPEVALDRFGEIPLPPYVHRPATEEDRERYQTVYARERGSVAAPTAGLHFTPELLARIEARGARIVRLVLHVGVGTFRPVEAEEPDEHEMHSEWYQLPQSLVDKIAATRARGLTFGIYFAIDLKLASLVLPSAETAGRDIGLMGVAASGPTVLAPVLAAAIIEYGGFAALFATGGVLALIGGLSAFRVKLSAAEPRG